MMVSPPTEMRTHGNEWYFIKGNKCNGIDWKGLDRLGERMGGSKPRKYRHEAVIPCALPGR